MTDPILDLTGRTALITGAGQGVGREIASLFSAYGARIVVNDFDAVRANEVATQCRQPRSRRHSRPPRTILGAAPTRSASLPARQPRRRHERHPTFTGRHDRARPRPDHHRDFRSRASGRSGRTEIYSGAKAGAAGFTRAIARLGGRYGITANCISLGATRTPATAGAMDNPELARRALSNYVIRRFGDPVDAANLALFLAGDAATWITGQTIPVNGGYSFTL